MCCAHASVRAVSKLWNALNQYGRVRIGDLLSNTLWQDYFFFSLATSRAIQEISIVYALAALAISVVFISLVGSEVR